MLFYAFIFQDYILLILVTRKVEYVEAYRNMQLIECGNLTPCKTLAYQCLMRMVALTVQQQ